MNLNNDFLTSNESILPFLSIKLLLHTFAQIIANVFI